MLARLEPGQSDASKALDSKHQETHTRGPRRRHGSVRSDGRTTPPLWSCENSELLESFTPFHALGRFPKGQNTNARAVACSGMVNGVPNLEPLGWFLLLLVPGTAATTSQLVRATSADGSSNAVARLGTPKRLVSLRQHPRCRRAFRDCQLGWHEQFSTPGHHVVMLEAFDTPGTSRSVGVCVAILEPSLWQLAAGDQHDCVSPSPAVPVRSLSE